MSSSRQLIESKSKSYRTKAASIAVVCALGSLMAAVGLGAAQSGKPSKSVGRSVSASAQVYAADSNHQGPAWFVNVAAQAGLIMQNVNGDPANKKYIIETTGSGVAVIDYDRDGWPDILLLNGRVLDGEPSAETHPTNHLYRNRHDGTFEDVTEAAGLSSTGWAQGVCVGDYDNDGYDDLFITYYGHNRLYHNEHGGTFKEVAGPAGVAGNGSMWGTGCSFVDYDRDGRLDLVVSNYVQLDLKTLPKPGEGVTCLWKGTPVMCGPRGLPFTTNILYHNTNGKTFEDVSRASGISESRGHYCFSVSTLDYNRDGWPDIYVACDSTPSILYRNNKDGTFTDVAPDAGVAFDDDGREQAGMGSAIGDYDGDGWPDIFKTNFSDDSSSLYRNNRDGTFTAAISEAGLGLNTKFLGWGTAFLDLDNSGLQSILIANGHVYPQVDYDHLGATYREPRLLYQNLGGGKFKDISVDAGPGCSEPAASRGLATADFFNDGRISAVINNTGDKPLLLVNYAANKNHWLGVVTRGTRSNRDGIGAQVTVFAEKKRLVQEVRSGSSYLSSSDLRLHFGLGSTSKIDRIDVVWPSGRAEIFTGGEVDRYFIVEEGKGQRTLPSP
jgi:hypothetical protein